MLREHIEIVLAPRQIRLELVPDAEPAANGQIEIQLPMREVPVVHEQLVGRSMQPERKGHVFHRFDDVECHLQRETRSRRDRS